jgi:GTP-binding protein
MEYTTLYASGKSGWAVRSADYEMGKPGTQGMTPLFETIIERIPPPPPAAPDAAFRMLVSTLDHDDHLGRILIGRITSGTIKQGEALKAIDREGKQIETGMHVSAHVLIACRCASCC